MGTELGDLPSLVRDLPSLVRDLPASNFMRDRELYQDNW